MRRENSATVRPGCSRTDLSMLPEATVSGFRRRSPRPSGGYRRSPARAVLLIAACVAFEAGALALALIRGKDFHAARGAAAEADTPVASASRP
jgi:hypothetical protein